MEVGGRGTGRAFSPIYPRLTTVVAYSNITDHYHYYCHHYSYSPLFPKGATACSVARRTVACRPFYCIAERLRSGRTAQASGRGDPTNRSANSPKRLRLPCIQSRGHTELSFFFFFCVCDRSTPLRPWFIDPTERDWNTQYSDIQQTAALERGR